MRTLLHQLFISISIASLLLVASSFAHAQTVVELQQKISDQTTAIQKLEQEIAQYQGDLATLSTKKNTLKNAIATLEVTRKKLETDIKVTQTKVDTTDLTIQKLSSEISYKEDEISGRIAALKEALLSINENDSISLPQVALSSDSFSGLWQDLDMLEQFSASVSENVDLIKSLKTTLEVKNNAKMTEKSNLLDLKSTLSDQKKITEDAKKQQTQLLTQTSNKESEYQRILAEKKAAKDQFEKELYDLESQLKFILDPSSIPAKGSKPLSWPLDVVRVTQYFGDTAFSRSGAYNGQGHNGIDLAASVGTMVHAALKGKVIAVNTKSAYMCQYGKWVLIQHDNGLTTLYAHLSLVNVSTGDVVRTGQLIGYSGETGYALGPHLHLTVYASKAVELKQYTCKSGPTVTIPVAAFSGYLNPMDYF